MSSNRAFRLQPRQSLPVLGTLIFPCPAANMLPVWIKSEATSAEHVCLHWAFLLIPPFILSTDIYSMPSLCQALGGESWNDG